MSGPNLDGEKIDFTCDCGATVTSTIGKLRRSPTLMCPQCDATIQVAGSDLDRGVRNIDRAFDKMDRAIRHIGQ